MALVDRAGRLVRFTIRPGNAAESIELNTLLDGASTNEVIADKAYDTNSVRLSLAAKGIIATVPPKSNRIIKPDYDKESYRTRHLVENFFADLKQFRGIATRYCKMADRYRAAWDVKGFYHTIPKIWSEEFCPSLIPCIRGGFVVGRYLSR